jgi:hypothetical protein
MRQKPLLLLGAGVAAATLGMAAHASPLCTKERTPFALSEDRVKWTITIQPGTDCIQGLRWSYMQIFNVKVVSGPSRGQLAVLGSGFRYSAEADRHGTDKFTLLISGKNRHVAGTSTLEVEVNSQ